MCNNDSRFGSLVRFFQPRFGDAPQQPMTSLAGAPPIAGATQTGSAPVKPSAFSQYVAPILRGAAAGAAAAPGPTTGLAAPGFGKQLATGLGAGITSNVNHTLLQRQIDLENQKNARENLIANANIAHQQEATDIAKSGEARAQQEFQHNIARQGLFDQALGIQNLQNPDAQTPPSEFPGLSEVPSSVLPSNAPTPPKGAAFSKVTPTTVGPTGTKASGLTLQDSPLLHLYNDQTPDETNSLRAGLLADATSKSPGLLHYSQAAQQIRTQRAISGRSAQRANASLFAKNLTPELVAGAGVPPDPNDAVKYPLGFKDPKFQADLVPWAQKANQFVQRQKTQLQMARGQGFAQARAQYSLAPVMIDTQDDNTLATPTVAQVIANPGRYVSAAQGNKPLQSVGLLNNVDAAFNEVEKQLPTLGKLDEADRLAVNRVLREHQGAIASYAKSRAAVSELPDTAKSYVAAVGRLEENIPSLRGILGQGQASDQRIGLLLNTISGLTTNLDPTLAVAQIGQARQEIAQARGLFPKLPNQGSGNKPPAGSKVISLQDFLNQK